MYEHETPTAPPKNTPFPGLILKVGKMNYCLGKMDPIWAKCLKSGQNFSRSGQKKIIHQFISSLQFSNELQSSLSGLFSSMHPLSIEFAFIWYYFAFH